MKIALNPRYVHGGFEAQSTGKVAFNRVPTFWFAPTQCTYVANECHARDGKGGLNRTTSLPAQASTASTDLNRTSFRRSSRDAREWPAKWGCVGKHHAAGRTNLP